MTFLVSSISAQEIWSIYEFKKPSPQFFRRIKYKITGRDVSSYNYKIELFTDKSFVSTEVGTAGIYISYYKQGNWKVENDTLILSTTRVKFQKEDNWQTDEWKESFLIKDKAIIPIINGTIDEKRKLRKK